jgi:serine/threonine protein kinase
MAKKAKRFGRWKVVGTIGEGGQAQVYLVEDSTRTTDGQFALKPLSNLDAAERRKRFEEEVKATSAFGHPNVLHIFESDLSAMRPYYVAEYCEGKSLEKVEVGRFVGNIRCLVDTLLPVIDALVFAHQKGIYHRDIKPGNVLFRHDGTPVVGDFGICHMEGGTPQTLSWKAMGSRHFTAPEMEAGRHHLGKPSDRTDTYSLGKLMYWMLSGGKIFDREDHRAPGVSLVELLRDQKWEHIHMLLDKMVVEKPEGRLHSRELKEVLQMTADLVEGNFAPLKPSARIKCRFCGLGKYERPVACNSGDSSIPV